MVLPLIAVGAIMIILLKEKERLVGLAVMLAGVLMWSFPQRPPILVSPTGGLVGVMTPSGRAMSKPRGEGFVARFWLANDGAPVAQRVAFERAGFVGPKGMQAARLQGLTLIHLTGRGAQGRVEEACAKADLVVLSSHLRRQPPAGCLLLDRDTLSATGAVAFWPEGGEFRIETAQGRSGKRLWTR